MSKLFLKQIAILSGIFGAILGLLSLIPIVRNIAVLAVIVLIAPIVIIYLKKLDIIKEVTKQDGMIIGAISGGVSIISFVIILTPIVLLMSLFLKEGYIYWIASLIKTAGFFVYIMLLSFMCLLNAITNSFFGLATSYLYDFLKTMKE